jgi:hypothetical protein
VDDVIGCGFAAAAIGRLELAGIMDPRIYCTYFDHNYLARGLALYQSLQRQAPGSRLWVLCLSEACHRVLVALGLPDLVPCSLAEFETADAEVAATRASRSTVEYYFTCTPAWMLYVLGREGNAELVTYLDGDLYFFASPEPIHDELQDASVSIIPHRFTAKIARMLKYGTFNVGWVGMRNDRDGRAVIEWWRQRCIEWCHDYVDGDRFADQGYLDAFPGLSPRVKIIEHLGANLAPWNIGNYAITAVDGEVKIDRKWPLIFFHFQGLRRDLGYFFFNSHRSYSAPFQAAVRRYIYKPYVDELLVIEEKVTPLLEVAPAKPHARAVGIDLKQALIDTARRTGKRLFQVLDIASGRAFLVFRGTAR